MAYTSPSTGIWIQVGSFLSDTFKGVKRDLAAGKIPAACSVDAVQGHPGSMQKEVSRLVFDCRQNEVIHKHA
eukprot:scaffold12890_cov52-Attheya_sp.AAC.5